MELIIRSNLYGKDRRWLGGWKLRCLGRIWQIEHESDQTKKFRSRAIQKNTCLFSGFKFPLGNLELLYILASGQSCTWWGKEVLGQEWIIVGKGILGSQDIVLIVCSLGSGKVCGPTEIVVFELSSNDEQQSNKQREMWRSIPETQNSTGEKQPI